MAYPTLLIEASRNWWTLLLRGMIAVLFAIMAFIWPGLTLAALVLLWGAFAFVDGIFAIVGGVRSRWWPMVIFGILGVAAGLVTLFMPGITAIALLMVIAAWAIVRGALEIVAAIRLRREITGEWLLILAGLLSIAFGILMVLFPGAGALAVVWLIGLQAAVAGGLLIGLAFKMRRLRKYGGGTRIDLDTGTPAGPGIKT